ncbi:unnamed protein product [Closterium sp. NIES-65]|nr:unnamed protein product [Closterium sp. NIES-65]
MHARKVFCDAFGLACEANPRLKYAYDELVSDEQLTLKDVYDLEGVKPLGMYATCPEPSIALTDPLCPSFAPLHSLCPSLHSLCLSFAPLHSLCPSLQSLCPSSSPPLLLPCPSLPLASHYLAVKGGLLRWHVDDELNCPFATGLFDIIIRNAFQKGVGGSATVIKAFHIAYVMYSVPLSLYPQLPFSLPPNPTECASVAPCAVAVTPGLPLTSSLPSTLPPNPTYVPLLPLMQWHGSHSRPPAHLILALYPSSQPDLCASVAPCAGAVTPGLPLTSSSPSTLPPNPTYVPLLPLMQWQSLQAFRSPHPRPLPFLPTPPMCLCCPFCSGSHSRPSAHLILALYPSSQPHLCASVAPFAVAVTPGLPLTSSSPSTLPPNPTYVPLLPLVQWQSLQAFRSPHPRPLPFLPTPPMCLCCPLCSGSHSRPSAHLILALYPSSQPHLCASVAPYAVAVTPGLPLTSSSPSTLPPNPTYVSLLPLLQWHHSRPSAHLILALFPSSQPHLCASVAPCAGAVTPGLPLASSSPSSLPPNPTYVPLLPLVQGQGSHSCHVEHGVQHHTTNGKKVSTDACVNHDQILSLHRKVKAAIKKYLDDTPDDQLSSWDADHQRWVFRPTGNVVISGSGFPNHIPDGADPDKRDKEEAEILVKYCRMQADKIERGCQAQGDGRDDEDNEVGNWMDEGDDEY